MEHQPFKKKAIGLTNTGQSFYASSTSFYLPILPNAKILSQG